MTTGKYCNREVVITGPETTVTEAAQLMRQFHVGDLVVVEKEGKENRPVGIVTDRDLVVEILAQEVSPKAIILRDIMSTEPASITETATLFDALEQMRERDIRRIMVVNAEGGLEGTLCADDVTQLIAEADNHLLKLIRRKQVREQQKQAVAFPGRL